MPICLLIKLYLKLIVLQSKSYWVKFYIWYLYNLLFVTCQGNFTFAGMLNKWKYTVAPNYAFISIASQFPMKIDVSTYASFDSNCKSLMLLTGFYLKISLFTDIKKRTWKILWKSGHKCQRLLFRHLLKVRHYNYDKHTLCNSVHFFFYG